MSLKKDLGRRLDSMWRRHSQRARKLAGIGGVGPTSTWNKHTRDTMVEAYQSLCEDQFRRRPFVKRDFKRSFAHGRNFMLSGGWSTRNERLESEVIPFCRGEKYVYSFWKRKKCLYVGRSGHGTRLGAYRNHRYLKEATRLEVRTVRTPGVLAKQECLAKHFYSPAHNKVKPGKIKWSKKCPVCVSIRKLRSELIQILPVRQGKPKRRK